MCRCNNWITPLCYLFPSQWCCWVFVKDIVNWTFPKYFLLGSRPIVFDINSSSGLVSVWHQDLLPTERNTCGKEFSQLAIKGHWNWLMSSVWFVPGRLRYILLVEFSKWFWFNFYISSLNLSLCWDMTRSAGIPWWRSSVLSPLL